MKKSFLTTSLLLAISLAATGQGWVGNSSTSPNSMYPVNSSLGVGPLRIGIGTNAPTAQFHTTGDMRFEGITQDDLVTNILGTDANGDVFWRDASTLLNGAWLLKGNASTNPLTDFVGTTDAQPLIFRTNGVEQMRINISNTTTGIGPVEIGQPGLAPTSNKGNLTIWGLDLPGYSFPYTVNTDVRNSVYNSAQSPVPGPGVITNTLGRLMRFNKVYNNAGTPTNAYFDIGIGDQHDFFITNRLAPGVTVPQKMFVISGNNVGINFPTITPTTPANQLPSANFHTRGTVRHENLPVNGGNMLVIDNFGNVFDSQIPAAGTTLQNLCGTTDQVTKADANGDLVCSQIYDNGNSVGIGSALNSSSNYSYTWAGGLQGPTLPPTSGTLRLKVQGVTEALAYIATSDANLKTDIRPVERAMEIINRLEGKTYTWNAEVLKKSNADNGRQYGFLAQDVAKVLPEAVVVNAAGKYGMNYNMLIPVLTEGIKTVYAELQGEKAKNAQLHEDIEGLKQRMEQLEQLIASKTGIDSKSTTTQNDEPKLFQNSPNPFNNATEIKYYLPNYTERASIVIFDVNGTQVHNFDLQEKGYNSVTMNAGKLVAGTYLYSLIVNGQVVDAKRMVLIGN